MCRLKRQRKYAGKYRMRICELVLKPIKPKPPMNLPQARIQGLEKNVERSKEQLRTERDRQRQQRDNERKQKQLRQRSMGV
jgi:outer membrane cobalamin receptor